MGKMSRLNFEALYDEWGSYIYSLAYRLTGTRTDAEDLTQEAFIRVFRFLKDYKGGSLKGWLYKIVTNTFYLKVEKDKKNPLLPGEDEILDLLARQHQPNAADTLIERENEARVQQAILSLPRDYRIAVLLADLEELNYQEISEVLGVPLGTVRSRISRGRHLLKEKLL